MQTSAINEPMAPFVVIPLSKKTAPMTTMLTVLKRDNTAYVTGPNVPFMDTELQLMQKARKEDIARSSYPVTPKLAKMLI